MSGQQQGSGILRITAGLHKGRRLVVPAGVRPSSGMVREALFSAWRERLPGAHLLDLFAGSGAISLEAVSRGAVRAVAVEAEAKILRQLRANLEAVGADGIEIIAARLPAELDRLERLGREPYDLIFADPPYDFEPYEDLLRQAQSWLAPEGELVLEHSTRVAVPERVGDLVRVRERRYGESSLSAFRVERP
ncbi:MAG TPA: 16S rRNA (guanine(966)-N(2))-methyltransferase RsmD [Thermoanaerobaculia bacterium]|nr:16S rRNA (guanine(966)-N(2))-methyltransferase RsmD [Thermoanaerobaculia bacterium]